jgi:hypothetical protein
MWILALAASVLLGYWAGRVGIRNGRSFGLCFLLGFLLGLIGVLIVYVIGPARDARTGLYRASGEAGPVKGSGQSRLKVCHYCEKLIPYEASYCQYCGEGISADETGR